MKKINLQSFRNKLDAVKYCECNNTTVKEVVLDNINDMISSLQNISKKIENDEHVINEDWVEVALPLNSMMNALGNQWYLNDLL